MARSRLVRLTTAIPALALFALLLAALLLVGDAETDQSRLAPWTPWMIAVAALAVVVLLLAIVRSVWNLIRDARARAPGARLARRLLWVFVWLALPPVLLVYGFAMRFLSVSVDSWFTVNIEQSTSDALQLGRLYLAGETAAAQARVDQLAPKLSGAGDLDARLDAALGEDLPRAAQWALFSETGAVRNFAAAQARFLEPLRPEPLLLRQVRDSGTLAAVEPLADGFAVRVLRRIDGDADGPLYLQGIFPIAGDSAALAQRLQQNAHDYQRLKFLRGALKLSFVLILTLVVLLSALLALLAALAAARRIVEPVAELARAADDIARGKLGREVSADGDDELGFLAASFNSMSRELAVASARETDSRTAIERQREHLDAILARLSSGVIAYDANASITACNRAAAEILGLSTTPAPGTALSELALLDPRVVPLVERLRRQIGVDLAGWSEELRLPRDGEAQILLLRGALVRARSPAAAEHVVVFDDLTVLNRAQRDAAWAEVAQRLAHEVKNPLTPIQLGAERLRHRLSGKLDADDAAVVERVTQTIVHQVDALKTMVNAFADYARGDRLQRTAVDLAATVHEVLDLYEQAGQIQAQRAIDNRLPALHGDPGRLRQLVHNLVKNAIEASAEPAVLDVELRLEEDPASVAPALQLSVADRGSGLPPEFDSRWFEPYVTTKSRGTGLGLAIVKKIVDEHGGRVSAENRPQGGALFVVTLPLA